LLGSCSLLFSADDTGSEVNDDAGGRIDAATIDAGPVFDGPPPDAALPLATNRLILRYFLDDDPGEDVVSDINEELVNDLALANGLQVTGTEGRRGLRWETVNDVGVAETRLESGHALLALQEALTFTFEFVLRVDDAGSQSPSILFLLSTDGAGEGDAALQLRNPDDGGFVVDFVFDGIVIRSWPAPNLGERSVLHFVFDSPASTEINRLRLYSNGLPLSADKEFISLAEDARFKFDIDSLFALGNAESPESRSLSGKIFYLAVYDAALPETVMTSQSAILIGNDDQPPPMP
tara:strand:+ start:20188 stop:21066 length:879 start_codon:yes stop_codon:yes gene_type:complete